MIAEEEEFDLVGLGGFANGEGEIEGTTEGKTCLSKGGADAVVGVGVGVGWVEDAAEIAGDGWRAVGTCPTYTCPSSPGLNDKFEQNPSDELMSRVSPSFDLGKYQLRS